MARTGTSAIPVPDLPGLLESCRFEELLAEAGADSSGLPPEETALLAGIAAHHLGHGAEAGECLRLWADAAEFAATGPLVSIIVPTFNRPELLRRALESIAAQVYRPVEAVVVNDAGSPVDDVLEEFSGRLDVRLVQNPCNLYLAASRNAGLQAARGEYVGYLDDDDHLYPHHVGHLVALLRRGGARAASAASHLHDRSDGDGGGGRLSMHPVKDFRLEELLFENVTPVQTVLHQRSLFDETGPFDGSLRANEDWEFWIRVCGITSVAQSSVPTSCVDRRHEGDRMTSRRLAPFLEAHDAIYRRYRDLSLDIGGEELLERQRDYLGRIRKDVESQIARDRKIAVALAVNGHTRADLTGYMTVEQDLWDRASPEGATTVLEAVHLPTSDPAGHAALLQGLLCREDLDYVMVLRPETFVRLKPGAVMSLAVVLERDPMIAAAGALDMQSCTTAELESWLGEPLQGPTAAAEQQLEGCCTGRSRPVDRLDTGCLLLRREAVAGLAGWQERPTAGNQWKSILSEIRRQGYTLHASVETPLRSGAAGDRTARPAEPIPFPARDAEAETGSRPAADRTCPDAEVQVRDAIQKPLVVPDLSAICNEPTGMGGHLLFLFNLVRETGAKHVVEIGLGGANSALALLLGLRETGGELTSIDPAELPEARNRIEGAGLAGRWRWLRTTSDDAAIQVRELPPVDILFIDGLHSYNQCRRDYFRYAPHVRRGGYILFHDSSAIQGVIDFTGELLQRGLGGVNLDYCNGVFLFHKRDQRIW